MSDSSSSSSNGRGSDSNDGSSRTLKKSWAGVKKVTSKSKAKRKRVRIRNRRSKQGRRRRDHLHQVDRQKYSERYQLIQQKKTSIPTSNTTSSKCSIISKISSSPQSKSNVVVAVLPLKRDYSKIDRQVSKQAKGKGPSSGGCPSKDPASRARARPNHHHHDHHGLHEHHHRHNPDVPLIHVKMSAEPNLSPQADRQATDALLGAINAAHLKVMDALRADHQAALRQATTVRRPQLLALMDAISEVIEVCVDQESKNPKSNDKNTVGGGGSSISTAAYPTLPVSIEKSTGKAADDPAAPPSGPTEAPKDGSVLSSSSPPSQSPSD